MADKTVPGMLAERRSPPTRRRPPTRAAPPRARVSLAHRRLPGAGGDRLHAGHDPAARRHAAAVVLQSRHRRRRRDLRRPAEISAQLFFDPRWSVSSGTRSGTTSVSSSSTCWCRTRSACCWRRCCPCAQLPGRTFYRTAIFIPTMLSFVIIGFIWKLILSAALGRVADAARRGRPESAVRALARQGRVCADGARR